jgi:hypothetical protein
MKKLRIGKVELSSTLYENVEFLKQLYKYVTPVYFDDRRYEYRCIMTCICDKFDEVEEGSAIKTYSLTMHDWGTENERIEVD